MTDSRIEPDGRRTRVIEYTCPGCCGKVTITLTADATEEQLGRFQIICPCQKVYGKFVNG